MSLVCYNFPLCFSDISFLTMGKLVLQVVTTGSEHVLHWTLSLQCEMSEDWSTILSGQIAVKIGMCGKTGDFCGREIMALYLSW